MNNFDFPIHAESVKSETLSLPWATVRFEVVANTQVTRLIRCSRPGLSHNSFR